MSRKHFVALASALLARRPNGLNGPEVASTEYQQWTGDVRAIADVCSQFCDRFDYGTFYAACGLEN